MQTVRRLYLYAVTLISLETILWGVINLVRAMFRVNQIGGTTSQLASSLSLILVGIPVFLLHWWLIQRNIPDDSEDHFSGIRAVFFYGVLLATLIPMVQNMLAIVDRTLLLTFQVSPREAVLGAEQSWLDNLIAIVLNGIAATYFYKMLRENWKAKPTNTSFSLVQEIFRYIWLLYGLGLTIAGVGQILTVLFSSVAPIQVFASERLAEGIAFTIVGTPLLAFIWRRIQQKLTPQKGFSARLVVLYILTFAGVGGSLGPLGEVISSFFQDLLGGSFQLASWISSSSDALGFSIPFGVVWAYYGRVLQWEIYRKSTPLPAEQNNAADAREEDISRQAALKRVYFYILSLVGLAATFAGINLILEFIVTISFGNTTVFQHYVRTQLANGLASTIIGLPLWLRNWGPAIREVNTVGEVGEHARQSLIRRGYLFLVLFLGVVGVMFTSGSIFFHLIQALLGDPADHYLMEVIQLTKSLLLVGVILVYHWRTLRTDNKKASEFLSTLHTRYPVLILDPGEGEFAEQMIVALNKQVEDIPTAIHMTQQGIPDEVLSEAEAVILPTRLLEELSEAFRLWLKNFPGTRLVVPALSEQWVWLDTSERPIQQFASETARIVQQLAEGQKPRAGSKTSPWITALAILGGVVALIILTSLVISIISEF